jgi:hypothetical protein
VRVESALPWLSLAAALGAGAAAGGARERLETGLKTLALAALAVFAYFRWIAPAAIPLALTLQTIGHLFLPRSEARWRRWPIIFPIVGWVALAQLFWNSGDGRLAVFADAAKAALLLALLAGSGLALRRILGAAAPPRLGMGLGGAGLVAMGAMALTLDWGLWPALAGAGVLIVSQLLDMTAWTRAARLRQRVAWGLEYAGCAAIAYAFLR